MYIVNDQGNRHLRLLTCMKLPLSCMLFTDQSNLHLILSSACLEFYLRYLRICSSNSQPLYAPPEDFGICLLTVKKMTPKNIKTKDCSGNIHVR